MPFCPNCGSYILLGNHSCSCGTTIRYQDDDDYEEQSRLASEAEAFRRWKKQVEAERRSENPYNNDFFNELHHEGVSPLMINRINEDLSFLNRKYGLEWNDVTFSSPLLIFTLKKNEKYFDATIKASYDVTSSFNDVVLLRETITPDSTRLYSNDQFKIIIKEMEERTSSKFHFCRLLIVDDVFMVSAVFDYRGYIVDLENMRLVE